MALPAVQQTVSDLIEEYDQKSANLSEEIASFQRAVTDMEMAATIQGTYAGRVLDQKPYLHETQLQKNLLKSGWRCLYSRLQIDRIASAKDKKLFEQTIEDPPQLTFENVKATFGDYFLRPRFHILRGLAETFADLDPAYKSHAKVRIGVKGLPKRVIIGNVGYWGSYGRDKIRDIINALAAYRGQPLMENAEFSDLDELHSTFDPRAGEVVMDGSHHVSKDSDGAETKAPNRGLTIRKFQNGNAHILFDKWSLLDINQALAEFYGDVLPDVEDDGATLRPSTAVARDLQYYWSSKLVIAKALEAAGIYGQDAYGGDMPRYKVLEPSCGDGRILDALARRNCEAFGVEVHPGRAQKARSKGHSVLTSNFLECEPQQIFDKVVMNPPFYGRHYLKHVSHALKFLKPGGILVTILPATAWYDHKELDGSWRDLPPGSFSESGTNVPTGILTIHSQAMRAAA